MLASYLSLQLARFDELRKVEPTEPVEGELFAAAGADVRAAGTEPASLESHVLVRVGLHTDAATAATQSKSQEPWMQGAKEVYGAVLSPYRHKGEVNHLNKEQPGLIFESTGTAPKSGEPVVVITTAGFDYAPGMDMERMRTFSAGVTAVRVSMTGVQGLQSQQSFFFQGVRAVDPMTLTFWESDAAIGHFAYGPGTHKRTMDQHNEKSMMDRSSFTRFRILESTGTWYGKA